MKFLIIITGWNCEKYAEKCIQSVINQAYKNFTCFVLDDASTDGTERVLKNINHKGLHKQFAYFRNDKNMGAAYSRWKLLTTPCSADVVVLLDLDDALEPNALNVIRRTYKKNVWATYGNWRNEHGAVNVLKEITDPRKPQFYFTAARTFKHGLVKHLKEPMFKDQQGNWMYNGTDVMLSVPIMELCGIDRIKGIKEPIYIYNQFRPGNTNGRFGGTKGKDKVYDAMMSKPKLKRLNSL